MSLRPYVECLYLWQQPKLSQSMLVGSPPSGFGALVFNLGPTYQTGLIPGNWSPTPRVFLTGQATQRYHLNLQEAIDVVGIVFRPTGLFHLLQIPLKEFTDQRIDASLIMDQEILEIWERLGEASSPETRIQLLIPFLEKRLLTRGATWDVIDAIAEEIFVHKGVLSLQHLLADYSLSTRQFQRKFQKQVGISPKFYSKLRRFSHICSLLIRQEVIDWHEMVYLGGYFDQSHFIKDFLAFMKENPTTYYQSPQELARLIDR